MQLITSKLIAPSAFPTLPAPWIGKYIYQLGICLCPSMDLVATFPLLTRRKAITGKENGESGSEPEHDTTEPTGDQNETEVYRDDNEDTVTVDVWRFNGQRVFSITIDRDDASQLQVLSISWRSDGQILAVLTSDNTIRLVNSFSGKIVHRFSSISSYRALPSPASPRTRRSSAKDAAAASPSKVKSSILSYSTHFSNSETARSLLRSANTDGSVTVDELLDLNADVNALLKCPANLPRELANIDVESFLPRLSCLPPVGFGGEDVFSSRTSIDAIFHSSKKSVQSGNVDVVIAGHNDGTLSARIFDSFELGDIDLNSATGMRRAPLLGHILKIAGRPTESEILILVRDAKRTSLHLLGVDMRFITHSGNTLTALATKATQLQNLLRYLTQIQTQLVREVKTAFDLPARFLRNINEDLETQDGKGSSFTTAAFHTITTGEVSGALKDWLNEQLGERGIKRWEKSVGDCLELTRRLVSEAWCPAVERTGVVISRLNGLALAGRSTQGDGGRPGLGLDLKMVEALRDTVDVMAIRGEECLRDVIKEINLFASFIKWLKWEVEASSLEDTSERLDEMREGTDHNEITKVLEYLESGLQDSVAKDYLNSTLALLTEDDEEEKNFYTSFKDQRKRNGGGSKQGPAFGQLLSRLRKQCDRLFEQIARSLQQGVMTRHITQLVVDLDDSIMDVRTISDTSIAKQHEQIQLHIIARKKSEKSTIIHQTVKIGENLTKSGSATTHTLQLPEQSVVLDVKFMDDHHFMVLVTCSDEARIYSNAVEHSSTEEWELRHCFKAGVMEAGMTPARLEINGRHKRRTVGVIDESGKGYVVLDLDSGDGEESDSVGDEVMSG